MKKKFDLKGLQVKSFKIQEVQGGVRSIQEEDMDSISPTVCTPCWTDLDCAAIN